MSTALNIRLLGGFDIVHCDHSLASLFTPRLQSLVAYLLLHCGAPVSRQQLAYLFWPDTSDAQARANLRHLLHTLRITLPQAEHWIIFDNQTIQWRKDSLLSLDVEKFERASAQTDSIRALQNAIQLYAGDLLPDCYEDWIAPERERLRQLFVASLEKLVLLLETDRCYDEAIQYAGQLLQYDPLHEATYRRLMRLHAIKGDRAGALRVYHTCATILQRELNIEPGARTQTAYRRLINLEGTTSPPQARSASHIPLAGRKDQWAALQAAWRNTVAGSPRLALVSGEAGIGKTRLAEEMVDWARRQGIQASTAYCFAVQRELAYVPLVTWLRDRKLPALDEMCQREVARLLPELLLENPGLSPPEPITEGWQRLRFFEALARALLGNQNTQLLLLEDLHWCDGQTLEFLHYLLNLSVMRPGIADGRKIFLIGTLRIEEENSNEPLQELLTTLRGQENLVEILLPPLDESETALLANTLTRGEISPEEALSLYRETEGNPLFVVETVRAELPGSLPPKIQSVIAARLARISVEARELAELASVIGRQFSFTVLASASDQPEPDLVVGLDELWQRRIIREQGTQDYDFSHDKIREVVYEMLSSARRRWLHRRVAQALEFTHHSALDAFYGKIGSHFEKAGIVDQAILNYRRAAESARKIYANREAVYFLTRCLDIIQSGDPTRIDSREMVIEIYENLGEIFSLIGEYTEARDAYHKALPHVNETEVIKKASLQRKIGNTWREQGQFKQALTTYKRSESILGTVSDFDETQLWQEWIQVKLEQMLVHYWTGQPDRIQDLLDETGPFVEQRGTRTQQAKYLLSHHRMDLRHERYRLSGQTVARQRLAMELIQESGSTIEIADHKFTLGFALLWSGNLDEAEEILQSALALAEKIGDRQLKTRCLTYLTTLFRMQRRTEAVREYAARNFASAIETNQQEYIFSALSNQAWLAWREGELREADALALEALKRLILTRVGQVFKWLALVPLIDIRLKQQRLDQAIEFAREILAPEQQRLPEALSAALEQAVADWEAKDLESASGQLHVALELAGQLGYL